MKICQVVASDAHGGLEKHVCELSNALAKETDVTVIAPQGLADRLAPGVRFIPLNLKGGRNNPFVLARLALTLRSCRFDIVHAQANKATAMLGRIRAWVPGVKIGTLHNQKGNTRMFARLDHAVAVSQGVAALLPQSVPHTVIYNGLRWQPQAGMYSREQICQTFGFAPSRPLLLAVGRLVAAKGFDVLVEACAPLSINLLIVGDGPERAHLESRARQSDHAHIRLAGHRSDVQALMEAADGVVISSRVEGFSYVFAEAMMLYKPVVSTDVPVANEVLPPEFVVRVDDVEGLRNAIEQAVQDPAGWDAAMHTAYPFAHRHFTLEHMAESTLALYRRLLEQNGNQ